MPKTTIMSKHDKAQLAASKKKPAAKKAPSLKAVAKATTKVLDKPAPAPKAIEPIAKPAATGAKATIIAMIEKGGVSAAEIAKKLGWPRAGGTISRAIALAPFKVAKVRDAEGVLRYSRAGG